VLEPVADQEGIIFVEVAIVEHQQELAAVGIESLDGVRDPRWEIPEVADAHVVGEIPSFRVDSGDPGGTIKHVRPLGGLVPMQLAHPAGIEPHVHAGDVLGDAELAFSDLAGPATRLQPHMRIGEREPQVGQRAVVRRRRHQQIGVLPVAREVAGTAISAALARPHGLRDGFTGLRACCGRGRNQASSRSRGQHVAARDGIHDMLPDMLRLAVRCAPDIRPSRRQWLCRNCCHCGALALILRH
jgi:hypothetical protein